jgi:uncharacterized phage protein (TIGR01671 family)
MRQIKFRAWDHKGGDINKPMFMVQPMGLLLRDAPVWLGMLSSEAILMQFTGLKDRTGKEIYEGDVVYREILSRDDPTLAGRYGDTGAVEECLGVYRVHLVEEWEILSIDINAMSLEVIGNIYENPDLLAEIR